ncbi:SAP domain-containing protein [uncultured Granulicatella sp.]|uniref:SAP domain-containing protein n=1 Tax=uncultured Granulicatella sp. TaxID=316089 RepID=UPI0028D07166|nr:SAP domain-containing protein [uncultured Granulicatella sp.]
MKEERPDFKDIHSFEEFNLYYWYREELSQICKSLGLEYRGTKQELNDIIHQYFLGNKIEKSVNKRNQKQVEVITLNTPLLHCGFSFNQKFRDYFSAVTGISPFKFNADMATAWRKVKKDKDITFTIQDMIKIYYGESNYAKYDSSACQWNQFLKDFCSDECSNVYSNKLKVASILWKEVRNSTNEKIYSRELLKENENKLMEYRKNTDSNLSSSI